MKKIVDWKSGSIEILESNTLHCIVESLGVILTIDWFKTSSDFLKKQYNLQ